MYYNVINGSKINKIRQSGKVWDQKYYVLLIFNSRILRPTVSNFFFMSIKKKQTITCFLRVKSTINDALIFA